MNGLLRTVGPTLITSTFAFGLERHIMGGYLACQAFACPELKRSDSSLCRVCAGLHRRCRHRFELLDTRYATS